MAEPAKPFVQPEAYDADGAPVAPDAVPEAVATGKAFFKKGTRVAAKNAAGEFVTIGAEDVGHPGYTILSPAQVEQARAQKQYGEGLGNVVKAGAAGAARGLTLGASDAALSAIGGDDTRRALKGLRDANPIASGVGEVGGALAPLVLSGGGTAAASGAKAASLAARGGEAASGAVRALGVGHRAIAGVGSLVERGAARGLEALGASAEGAGVLARAGAGAVKLGARGAAEGALYGGAQAANDAVLNGDQITAEKVVAGMGHGALFGGAIGGALGAAGPLLSGAASKLIPKPAALEQLSREQALKGAGFKGSDFRRLAGRATGEAADARLAATADDLLNTTLETGALKGQRVLQPGANVEETLQRISQGKSEAAAKLGGLKSEISEGMAAAGYVPDAGEFLRRVDDQVIAPLRKGVLPGTRSEARIVERELSTFRENYEAALQAGNPDQMAMSFQQLDDLRRELAGRIYPKKPPGGGLPPPPPKGVEQLAKAERILADFMKEEASGFLARAGENPNAYNEANRAYHSFRQLEDVGTKTANQSLGNRSISPSDHALGIASFMGALATGNVGALGAMGAGAAAGLANKLLRERGNSLVADMARRASEMDSSIDRVAQVLAGKAENAKTPLLAAASTGEGLRDSYERTAARVRELAVPQAAQAHISSLIPEVAAQYPLAGAAVSTKLLQIYQQLAAQLPKSHVETGTTLTPLAVRERVSPVAMRTFMSQVRGALEPEHVIQQLSHGIVDRDAIAALKVAHPLTFQQLRAKVADYVELREDELPYKRRIMLSTTFDFIGDSSLEPQRMAGLQQVAESLSFQEAAQDAQAIKPKAGNPGVSKLGKTMTTPMDSALSGGT